MTIFILCKVYWISNSIPNFRYYVSLYANIFKPSVLIWASENDEVPVKLLFKKNLCTLEARWLLAICHGWLAVFHKQEAVESKGKTTWHPMKWTRYFLMLGRNEGKEEINNIKIAYEKCKRQLSHFLNLDRLWCCHHQRHEGHWVEHGQQRDQQEVDWGPSWLHGKLNQPSQGPPKITWAV